MQIKTIMYMYFRLWVENEVHVLCAVCNIDNDYMASDVHVSATYLARTDARAFSSIFPTFY